MTFVTATWLLIGRISVSFIGMKGRPDLNF